MKKWIRYILLLAVWMLSLAMLCKLGLITSDIHKLKEIIRNNTYNSMLLFLFVSFARIAILLPDTIFMILGGICFGPLWGIILSMTAFLISESFIYIVGRYVAGDWIRRLINERYKNIFNLLDKYGYEFLALGVLCPILPTDLICCGSAMLRYGYKKYIVTTSVANIPMLIIYSFIGESFGNSIIYNILLLTMALLIANFTITAFKKLKKQVDSLEISS